MPGRGSAQPNVAVERSLRHNSQPQGLVDVDSEHGTTDEPSQETGTGKRARWSHDMKLYLIRLLKDHDVPGFRTHNAWSKEAWTNIVCRLNNKFSTSFTLNQVKQKEQDLKKYYHTVKDLLEESGFGWDNKRKMVTAPAHIWANFGDRKNSSALNWQDKAFPYYEDLAPLYEGRYAEGRTRHGMDHYASKSKGASVLPTQPHVAGAYQSPSPTLAAPSDSGLQFPFDEDIGDGNLYFSQRPLSPMHNVQAPPSSRRASPEIPRHRHGKKQKSKSGSPDDGFHERYLKLKKEEIDRFVAIEEKKLEDPYSINKCITVLEGLHGLQMGDILIASDIFKSKDNRKVFLSFTSEALRLAWISREIGRSQTEHQN